jgi:hypothetical protein
MRVRYVSTYPPTKCGVATYTESYVKALQQYCNADVLPLLPNKSNPFYFIRQALKARKDTDIIHVQYDCGLYGILQLGRLRISGLYTPLFYLCLRTFNNRKIFTTIHEVHTHDKFSLYFKVLYNSIAWGSDTIIFHTEGCREAFNNYVQ